MTRVLSMAGLICTLVQALVDAKILPYFNAGIPNAPAAAVLRKSRLFVNVCIFRVASFIWLR
jgi:hypothetical protein